MRSLTKTYLWERSDGSYSCDSSGSSGSSNSSDSNDFNDSIEIHRKNIFWRKKNCEKKKSHKKIWLAKPFFGQKK